MKTYLSFIFRMLWFPLASLNTGKTMIVEYQFEIESKRAMYTKKIVFFGSYEEGGTD